MPIELDTHLLMSEALIGAGTSVWAWDLQDDLLSGMDGSVALLGYSPGELEATQEGWNKVIHPEDLPANHAAYLRHAEGHIEAYESEYRALDKNGHWRWLSERGRIVERACDGTPLRMVGTLSDVSWRHAAKGEAAERDERLRQITRHVPGLLYQFRQSADGHGTVPYVSERCRDVLGLDPEALVLDANVLLDRIDPGDRQRVRATLEGWNRNQATRRIDFRYRHPDGHTRWLLSVSSPRPEPEGGAVWHGYLEDITDHRELEKARELAAAAEAANRAKTDFLSRMSHELRTPLNAVLGFSQLMQMDTDDPLSESQLRRLTLVRESGEHLLRMIGDLLDHSRIEAGQLSVDLADLPVAPMLRECVAMLEPMAAGAGVFVHADELDDALLVRADATRLKQVVLNLLGNAIKYNRRGGQVRFDLKRRRNELRLSVVDNGVGIAREHMPHLFEPFNRLGHRRSGIEGTGIGLAITRGLVTLMNGRLEVKSEIDAGSTFTVILPAGAST
jgi:PAS domain S-box-containing protein